MKIFRYHSSRFSRLVRGSTGLVLTMVWLIVPLARSQGLILATPEELERMPPALVPYRGKDLPNRVDLTPRMPPVGNQGQQSSCVGWTVAYAMKSFHERVEENVPYFTEEGRLNTRRVFSPAFLYNQVNNGQDQGMHFRDALNFLKARGVCSWADMPYNPGDYTRKPSSLARQNARKYRILDYKTIYPVNAPGLKAQLAAGFPVMVGIIPDDGFNHARDGFRWDRQYGKTHPATPHAVLLVGYDDNRKAFRLMNSYGTQWGDEGFIWVDYRHLERVAPRGAYIAMDASNDIREDPRVRPDPRPYRPDDPVTPTTVVEDWNPQKVSFKITDIEYNATYPNRPDLGSFIRFDGTLTIPPGMGRMNQVVVHFYANAGNGRKGAVVKSRLRQYADVNGNAACGTAVYPIPREGLNTKWTAWIPYKALHVYQGRVVRTARGPQYRPHRTELMAEPVLFVDNFGVDRGRPIPFYVNR